MVKVLCQTQIWHTEAYYQELDQSHSNTTSDDYDGDDYDGGLANINDDDDSVADTGNKDTMWLGFVEKLEKISSLLRHSFPIKTGRTPVTIS